MALQIVAAAGKFWRLLFQLAHRIELNALCAIEGNCSMVSPLRPANRHGVVEVNRAWRLFGDVVALEAVLGEDERLRREG